MNKKFKFLLAAVCLTLTAGLGMTACGDKGGENSSSVESPALSDESSGSLSGSSDSSTSTASAPVLETSAGAMTIPAGTKLAFPAATATDENDGDLTEQIKVVVFDKANNAKVYPADADSIALKEADWTPATAGVYEVTYFVVNAAEEKAEKSFEVTSLSAELNGIAQKTEWLTRNASFNADGYLEIGKPSEGETANAHPAVAFSGEKVGAGDVVTFTFNSSYTDGGVSSWFMAFGLTPGYASDEPTLMAETSSPCIFEIRQNKLYIRNGAKVREDTKSLLDGKDHTISAKFEVTETRVIYSVWIDAATSAMPTMTEFVYPKDYEGTSYAESLFDKEKFGGYFNVIGDRPNVAKTDDTMLIKAFTVNGKAQIEKPVLKVDAPEKIQYLDEDVTFPAATAKDGTFGFDLSDRVEIRLIDAEGHEEEITGAYRFTKSGDYTLKYRVSDAYGNIEVKRFEISCASKRTENPPKLTVEGYEDGDELTGSVMTEIALPAVTVCEDDNGDDLTSRLTVSVTGPMSRTLRAGESFVPYAAGDYKIVYSVSDLTGKTADVTLTLTVSTVAANAGNQITKNPGAFVMDGSTQVEKNEIHLKSGEGSFVYTGQMIYEEKVSMLLDWTIASSHAVEDMGGTWDGSFLTMINMRGGASLDGAPASANGWPEGFMIHIDPYDHLTIQPAGHQTGIFARLTFNKLRDAFYGKDVLLEYQIQDVYNESGKLDYYRIMLWLDGVRVGSEELPWTWAQNTDSDGNYVVRARMAAADTYANLTKAGWLKVTTYCGDKQTGRDNIVKWLSIDGNYVKSTVNVTNEEKEVSVTETYTFPTVELLFNEEPMPLTRTLYLGNAAEGRVLGAEETDMVITGEHMEGLRIEYSYEGIVYHTTTVKVNAAVSNVVWSANIDGIVTKTATEYALPTVTSVDVLGETKTDGFVYRIAYASGYTTGEITGEALDGYRPILPVDYTVTAYIAGQTVGSYTVTNTSGVGDLKDVPFDEGEKFKVFYTGEMLWENTVTMNITITDTFDVLFLPIRGSVEYIESTSNYNNWLSGVTYRFYGSQISLLRNVDQTTFATYTLPAAFVAQGDHMISYRVVNNKGNDGTITSISVTLWLDGEEIGTTQISMSAIADFGGAEPAPLWGKQYGNYIRINSMYINDEDGTKVTPVVHTNVNETATYEVLTETQFTIPTYTKILGQEAKKASVTLNGEAVTSETYVFAEEGAYVFVYTVGGEEVKRVTVTAKKPAGVPVFTFTGSDGEADTVERSINQTLNIPFSYMIGDEDFTEEVSVKLYYGNYVQTLTYEEYTAHVHKIRQNFKAEYLYMGEVLATKNVTVTGAKSGNVVTEATNKQGGTEADGVWTGTLSPAYTAENLHDYTASLKFRLNTFGYVAIGLRGEAKLNAAYGYDWPANARFALDNGRVYVYLGGDQPVASTGITDYWNSGLEGTDVVFTIQVRDEFDEKGAFLGTAVKFWINGNLIQLDDPGMHKGNTLADGNTMYVAATRGDVVWDVWNAPLNFGMFRTQAQWEIKEVYFDGTVAQ